MKPDTKFNLITDSEFTEKELDCAYLLPPPEVFKSEAIIAKKELKAYSDNSIKTYTSNGVYNFIIQPLQDSLISLDSLKLNIVAHCIGSDDRTTPAKMLLGDFTLMNHISQITLRIGGADVQTISNPCIIKNMSKLFKYGSIRSQNHELTINGLYPRDQINNPLATTSVTTVADINNIYYKPGVDSGNPGTVAGTVCDLYISEIIPLSDIFQVDFSLYPFIYNRKIEVSITWNSEKNVDINTLSDTNTRINIKEFSQYYLMYEASILNQDSRNQMIKAYQKKVSALIPNTNYILSSLSTYTKDSQLQQTISIPIGFSSESITLFFPNSTSASEHYSLKDQTGKLNTTHHTCNSFRFMNLQKVVISCGTNVLKTFDFTENSTDYNNSSTLLKTLTNLTNNNNNKIRNYSIAYNEYLECECPKVSYPEFLSDYFCLYVDTRPFSQIASNNTLQIDVTFGNIADNINENDGVTNQRKYGEATPLRHLGVITKNTKVLSFDPEGSCSVFNVANNILNDYMEL